MLDFNTTNKWLEDMHAFVEAYESNFDMWDDEHWRSKYNLIVNDDIYLVNKSNTKFESSLINQASIDGHTSLSTRKKEYCIFYDLEYIQEKPLKRFYFLTLTGKDRIPDTPDNIENMLAFGKALFNNDNYIRFHKVLWNIETGKHQDKPNLHIHACIWFENTNKNFHSLKPKGRSDVRNTWNNYFKSYGLDYGKDSYKLFSGKMVHTIYKDKCDYLKNVDKSIMHKNYRNLEILIEL